MKSNYQRAILTKYHGAKGSRGSRISASSGDCRVYIPYPHEAREGEEAHRLAANALCDKLGWTGELIAGSLGNDFVFVFKP